MTEADINAVGADYIKDVASAIRRRDWELLSELSDYLKRWADAMCFVEVAE